MSSNNRWAGLKPAARACLSQRDYSNAPLSERLSTAGVGVGELLQADRTALSSVWIPGVELIPRRVFRQRHRGYFGEFARQDQGVLGALGFWPRQWATSKLFAGTCKGFHIHPPYIPEGVEPAAWFSRLYGPNPAPVTERPYQHEQWDVMFFIQSNVEIILVDERAGLERRVMRFFVEGDDSGGSQHAGVVIPAGVAHALRGEGSADLIMVYGTTTTFDPEAEGRIAIDVESAPLPDSWRNYSEGNA